MVDFAYRNQHSFPSKRQKPNSNWLNLKEIHSVTERPMASGMAGSRNSNTIRTKLILSPFPFCLSLPCLYSMAGCSCPLWRQGSFKQLQVCLLPPSNPKGFFSQAVQQHDRPYSHWNKMKWSHLHRINNHYDWRLFCIYEEAMINDRSKIFSTTLCEEVHNYMYNGGGLVAKLCPTLATPWTVACQAPLSMGFSR